MLPKIGKLSTMKPKTGLKSQMNETIELNSARATGSSSNTSLKKYYMDNDENVEKPRENAITL